MSGQLLLYIVVSFSLLLHPAVARYEDKKKWTHTPAPPEDRLMNVCDLQSEQHLNMFCYCDTKTIGNATDANCWLFNNGEPEDSPVWNSFKTQRHLTKIVFHIRAVSILPYVPTRAFKHLPKLKTVEIVYANIETVEPFAFANLTLLQDLALTRNKIVNLKKFSISFLPDLKVITLGENRIGELGREVFVSLPSLRKLYMERNNLSLIHEGAFAALYSLEELELHGNQLSVVTRQTFRGLRSLRRLDLSSNSLTYLADGTFMELPSLEELIIERNSLESIDPGALANLEALMKLYLAQNYLRTLPPNIFEDCRSLRFVNLRDNSLHTVTYQVFQPIMHNLLNSSAYLIIDGNPLVCDCRLDWLHTLMNRTVSEPIRSSIEELTCRREEPIESLHTGGGGALPPPGIRGGPRRGGIGIGIGSGIGGGGGGIIPQDDDDDNDLDDDFNDKRMEIDMSEIDNEVHFLAVPRETLPCPGRATGLPAVQLATKPLSSSAIQHHCFSFTYVIIMLLTTYSLLHWELAS